ncbi:MAG: FAD-binding oxidoreductase [Deltaproteobacteria bacterium]|nr:FAD-binding oxidoreductase [Deltaproteobacteria bacterium]
MTEHDRKVARVAQQLRARTCLHPLSLRKRAASHQVPKPRDLKYREDKLDVSDLDRILDIDVEGRTCTAEPGVTFVDLVAATMRHGLVPLVVPELKTITVGGAVSGCSIESMSFVYGGFHDTCLEYEVVTTDGEILVTTPDNEHRLVHEMVHGAFGTLGIITRLKFRLLPAARFVRLEYHHHSSLGAYQADIHERYARRDVDFMDGIIHGPEHYVLSLGRFVDQAPYTSTYNWMTAYYETTAERHEDYFRTPDYFFRYDRGVTNVRPRSKLGRLLVGRFLHSSQVLRIAEKIAWALPADRPGVTVDVFVPFSRFAEFMDWYWREFGVYPLWCVPYRPAKRYPWLSDEWYAGLKDELMVDLAIYGYRQPPGKNCYRMLEEKLMELNGVKTLISFNYYREDEFWRIWHRENYAAAKSITDPRNLLRDLFSKTCRATHGLE